MTSRYHLLLESLSPISHGDTVTGIDNQTNTRIFMRQAMLIDGKPARIPAISENALRSVLFRGPVHDDLLVRLDIKPGTLPRSVNNLLFSGGNMAAGSKAPGDEMALGHGVKKLYPSLDLLGGAVDGFILPRSRLRLTAWLIAKEYAPMLELLAPEYIDDANSVSAYDLLMDETRVRGAGSESDGNQMIYSYETLAAGAKLLIEITIDLHAPEATAAVAGHALQCWDGYFGGQNRQGRGRMAVIKNTLPESEPYIAHIDAYGDTMKNGLLSGTMGTDRTLCDPRK